MLRSAQSAALQERSRLTAQLAEETLADPSGESTVDIQINLDSLGIRLDNVEKRLKAKEDLLAEDGQAGIAKLRSLKTSKYLQALVSAKAFKSRIRTMLRRRKFELRRMIDDYRSRKLRM